jgi:SAM-dependent methyltransferase
VIMGRARASGRVVLLALLACCAVLNHNLFTALLGPLIALLALAPFLGIPAALCVSALFLSTENIESAIRQPPWVPTPAVDLKELLAAANVSLERKQNGAVFLELGSGDGRNLILAVEHAGYARAIGLEVSPVLVAISRLRARLSGFAGRITIKRADLLAPDALREAGIVGPVAVVYVFLSVDVLRHVAPQLACTYGGGRALQGTQGTGQHGDGGEDGGEDAADTIVLSRDFALPGWGEPLLRLARGPTELLAYSAAAARAHHEVQGGARWSCGSSGGAQDSGASTARFPLRHAANSRPRNDR